MLKSIKRLLMQAITQRLLSRQRLLRQRARTEAARRSRGEPHRVHYFHQVDDPYSALASECLPKLLARYDIDIVAHVVGPPPDAAAPERDRLIAYSRKDAQLLARHRGLHFSDSGTQPSAPVVERATALLVAAIQAGRFTDVAGPLSDCVWRPDARPADLVSASTTLEAVEPAAAAAHVSASDALRRQLGHYLGATFHYGGEWYWGIDRVYHLERRLQDLGAQRAGVNGLMFAPDADLQQPHRVPDPPPIDFFVSLRSPYSAIVAPRVFELGRLTGAPVRLRPVLPMVMRGLPVPREKRVYISQDAAREAFVRGIAFGRLNDPLGAPTERGMALLAFADKAGKGREFLLAFMHGVWAEGIDAGSDRGLRRIAERAGLQWAEARQALRDEGWRATAERNRAEMFGLGLWGVPSFRVRDTAVWGQDRLWAVEQAVLGPARERSDDAEGPSK